MAKKEKKERVLTEAEQKRLEQFEKTSGEMEQQGYIRRNLTIDIGRANVFAVFLIFPLIIIGYGLYYLAHHRLDITHFHILTFLVLLVMLVVVHELIHGVCWSFFTPNHFKDIEFGFIKSSLTPYCCCLAPLEKRQYIFGSVMPLVLLGIIPMIAGIAFANPTALFLGIMMADGAAGDIMIIHRLLKYKSSAKEIVYMDHPTEAGGVVFER